MFAPGAVFSEFPAVVAPENHNGILREAEFFEFSQHLADAGIDEADCGVVTVFQGEGLFIGNGSLFRNPFINPNLARVPGKRLFVSVLRKKRIRRQLDFVAIVDVPILFR